MPRAPQQGDVYRDERGRLLLFVGKITRPGVSVWSGAGPDDPEYHFVGVDAENRTVVDKWYMVDGARPLPERLELVINAGADDVIRGLEGQLVVALAERAAFAEAMKTAVGVVPVPVANHLRAVFREARGEALKGIVA